ncbi:MAG: TraR/DksA C4-type zinc finger protein [Actinomycetota bacterium]
MPDEFTIDDDALARLRSGLHEQRANLRKEIADRGGTPDSDDVEIDMERNLADSGHSTTERTQAIAVVKALRSNLRLVDRALGKVGRGEYGTCESCGRPIGIERLEALPWAILCIDCKQAGSGGGAPRG